MNRKVKPIVIHVDGGAAGTKHVGIAAIARSHEGYFVGWVSKQLPQMTNNEAEYQAAMLGLGLAQYLDAKVVNIIADSEVVVRQMMGLSRVNSNRLRPLHQKTCQLVARFDQVQFCHVKREQNMLADALASEAILGRTVSMPPRSQASKMQWPSVSFLWQTLQNNGE